MFHAGVEAWWNRVSSCLLQTVVEILLGFLRRRCQHYCSREHADRLLEKEWIRSPVRGLENKSYEERLDVLEGV